MSATDDHNAVKGYVGKAGLGSDFIDYSRNENPKPNLRIPNSQFPIPNLPPIQISAVESGRESSPLPESIQNQPHDGDRRFDWLISRLGSDDDSLACRALSTRVCV